MAIVEAPSPPALPAHSTLAYFALAFGFSSLFAVAAAFTAEYLDATVRTPVEAQQLLEVPVLAWLPAPEREMPRLLTMRAKRPEGAQ